MKRLAPCVIALVILGSCDRRDAALVPTAVPPSAIPAATPEAEPSPTPTVTATPAPAATARPTASADRPEFVPVNKGCRNTPRVAIDRQWQTSAPREPVRSGAPIEVGLRNKFGDPQESYSVTVTVYAPDGSRATGRAEVSGDAFADSSYPEEFPDAPAPPRPGTYTVVWEAREGFLACDGFQVAA